MSELRALRAELGRVTDLLADAHNRELATALARFKEEVVAPLNVTEQKVRVALG